MKHVMVDLETLGTVPGCQILSIGAVEFFPNASGLGAEFYSVVSVEDQDNYALHVSAETEKWWEGQSPEARKVLSEARSDDAPPLAHALNAFNDYLRSLGSPKDVLVYGNGADFDNGILAVCYREAEIKPGWASYNGRCYRTLKNLAKNVRVERGGTYHNALDDAKTQARHLVQIVRAYGFALA